MPRKKKVVLTPDEMQEMTTRIDLISTHRRTALLLESEYALFLNHLLSEKGLDPAKRYNVNRETLEVTEAPDA